MQSQTITSLSDDLVAALLQHLYLRYLGELMLWQAYVETMKDIEDNLRDNRLPKPKVGIQKHNLNVLRDYLLIHKALIMGLRLSLDKTERELDRRGYPANEREQMKAGGHV